MGRPRVVRSCVVVGDTEATEGLSEHVRDADLLVIEATFLERDAAMAIGLRSSHRGEGGRACGGRRRKATYPHAHLGTLRRRRNPGRGHENIRRARVAADSIASRSEEWVVALRPNGKAVRDYRVSCTGKVRHPFFKGIREDL